MLFAIFDRGMVLLELESVSEVKISETNIRSTNKKSCGGVVRSIW